MQRGQGACEGVALQLEPAELGCQLCGQAASSVAYLLGGRRAALGRLCAACERRMLVIFRAIVRSAPRGAPPRAKRMGHA